MNNENYLPVFQLTRGDVVESIHFGAIAVVDKFGKEIASFGNPMVETFLRSTAKPFQAMPFVEMGGPDALGFTDAEIALICASHSGTPDHVSTLLEIQRKAGISEGLLQCGIHPPLHKPTADALIAQGTKPIPNQHNCSGKHSGMLAFAKYQGWPLDNYLDKNHPVQKKIIQTFAEMTDLPISAIHLGVDGCSAPNFAVPLENTARAYARLCDPTGMSPERAAACQKLTHAMTSHPEMVGGPERFDTMLMQVTAGRIVSKGGAEGYQGIGLMPGALFTNPLGSGPSPALGIAIKISDGDLRGKISAAVTMEVLRQINALSAAEMEDLSNFGPKFQVNNWRKIIVGQGKPAFKLQWNDELSLDQ